MNQAGPKVPFLAESHLLWQPDYSEKEKSYLSLGFHHQRHIFNADPKLAVLVIPRFYEAEKWAVNPEPEQPCHCSCGLPQGDFYSPSPRAVISYEPLCPTNTLLDRALYSRSVSYSMFQPSLAGLVMVPQPHALGPGPGESLKSDVF